MAASASTSAAAAAAADPQFPIYISSDEDDERAYQPLRAASASAAAAGPSFPIYVSSDEEDERAYQPASYYSPDEVQIQQALFASFDSSRAAAGTPFAASSSSAFAAVRTVSSPTGDVQVLEEATLDRKGKRSSGVGRSESGKRSSKRRHFTCAICFETVDASEKFPVSHCSHEFCNSCIGSYVASKVAENVVLIGCPNPGCKDGSVEINLCKGIIPPGLFDRWNVALCEDAVGGDKFYCPYKDCSAMLINDGKAKIRKSECPHCHRLFCASCRVPWHDGIKCREFMKLADDEKGEAYLNLKKLAEEKKWQRCPKCKIYVERVEGCVYITCRCKHRFCYLCAAPMVKSNHYCSNCKRTW